MVGAHLCIRAVSAFKISSDPTLASSSSSSSSSLAPIRFHFRSKRRRLPGSILASCSPDRHHPEFLEASLLLSETVSHYRMLRQGLRDDAKWHSPPHQFVPFSVPTKNTVGQGFLSRFKSPTIFLKISSEADFLLPIIVGEFAIEKLIEDFGADDTGGCPDQFHFVKNFVAKLGYEVKMVKITERVVNTYFAKLYLGKPGENDILSVDARPSDAINVANRCKAPIYVNKQIVLMDAIRIGYGMGRVRDRKPTYDVSLDSAADGPDILTEELNVVKNMSSAIEEERYNDAAMWRDKLMKLLDSEDDH